ncbi:MULTISPECIES: flagellar hook-associated protein FlgL [unclassified Herbaspirillum]|uniref:flagellar hook-associated protein FlgL n=1 Tax=unclassified Herbaspirillum TaxID=2624150 RepID=UPI000E2E7F32|nr:MULTISPECIES: flagellar hook-associated protein FlgL [unclassified Herbaspirillum]RFB68716.1 flagellar hook-associated protein 3 [Herbaspirillum sp. 3R-3a1]TFI05624.1 flagellar hook-associated protein 3 [Herbaspirillum sp. 3R11]TFI13466.1 flagellar hook-associated protein 3 [Herbaspirillum sp. 3R-11]TFI27508.1 flagellar hook-associated protein 3 [Herbaspirillum sp. 3C11]
MRISTSMLYQLSNTELTSMQGSILKLNQQVTQQQTVLLPSDDAVAAARALDLSQTQGLNDQYKINRNNADSSLSQVNAALTNVTAMLTKIKSNITQAGNAAYSNSERANMATELKGNLKEMLGFANATDALGNYLFSGFKATTQPFDYDSMGNIVYNGDQGQQSLQVDSTRNMEISVSGQAVFQGAGQDTFKNMQDLITLLQVPVTEAANNADTQAANTFNYPVGSLPAQYPIQAYKTAQAALDAAAPTDPNYSTLLTQAANAKLLSDKADAARTPIPGSQAALTRGLNKLGGAIDLQMNSVGAATASVGARQSEIDNLNATGDVLKVQYEQSVNDLLGRNPSDLAANISALSLQQTYLQAAQKSFVTTSSLTLLNYLK